MRLLNASNCGGHPSFDVFRSASDCKSRLLARAAQAGAKGQMTAPTAPDPSQVNQVSKWLLDGHTAFDIQESLRQHYPDADHAALLLAAMKAFEKDAENTDSIVVIGWCFAASRDLYRRMIETGDYQGALRAVKQIADLAAKHQYQQPDDAGE